MSTPLKTNRRDLVKAGAVLTVAASGVTALATYAPEVSAQLARNETLYTGGFHWGPPTSFSPISPSASSTWPVQASFPQVWEQLASFNILSGEIEPLLAKEMAWDGTTSLTVTLQDGTTWADGEPLTADDVVFTYELPNTVDGLPFAALTQYVSGVEKVDDRTVKLLCEAENNHPGMVNVYLQSIPILPKHIWEPLNEEATNGGESITGVVDLEPIASGPYKIMMSSPEQIVLERRDDYWGNETLGQPAPRYIVHPIPKGNDDLNLAFSRGELDLSQTFMPQIWQLWEEQDIPAGTWFKDQPYHLPGTIPSIILNVTRPGLDNKLVRKALAHSINYAQIAETAMSRYSNPVSPSLVIPDGAESQYHDVEAAEATGWEHSQDEARRILEEELGATKGDDGIYTLEDGTRLGPWKVVCPYGWTDWMTALELVVQGAREVGFDLATEFPEAPVRMTDMQNGNFDITMESYSGVSAAGPWSRFRDCMDNRGVPEIGQTAFYNYNRFKSAEAEELLDQIPTELDTEKQKELYTQLDEIYREEVPIIGLMYRPYQFYSFNETHWKGFATSENDYAPPSHLGSGMKILSNIEPTGQ